MSYFMFCKLNKPYKQTLNPSGWAQNPLGPIKAPGLYDRVIAICNIIYVGLTGLVNRIEKWKLYLFK